MGEGEAVGEGMRSERPEKRRQGTRCHVLPSYFVVSAGDVAGGVDLLHRSKQT